MLVLCLLWLSGCAQPPSISRGEANVWSGRLALQVEGQAAQSFSALFELRGTADAGGLALFSPLGNQLAQVEWSEGRAHLESAQETRDSHSLDALLQEMTGTSFPVAALFSWLKGLQLSVPGWRADLSGVVEGRLVAHRDDPEPRATLRIALTR